MSLIKYKQVSNQQGFVLILAMVLLTVLTLIGVSSMNTANIELKTTANAQQHQFAFNAATALLEYAVSKGAMDVNGNLINYQTTSPVPQQIATIVDTVVIAGTVTYAGCSVGVGSSLEEGKAFGNNYYSVSAIGTNSTNTAFSQQAQGARHFAAACEN